MAEDANLSYSFSLGGQPPTPPVDDSLYALTQLRRVPLGNGGVLLLDRDSDRQLIVAEPVSIALGACATFRTLDQHAAVMVRDFPQLAGQTADVLQVLTAVRDAGLLRSAGEYAARWQEGDNSPAQLAPAQVFIMSCDRPEAVARLLDSLLRLGNLGKYAQLTLVDDSRTLAGAKANQELVADFNITSAKHLNYVGAHDVIALQDALVEALPDCEAPIRFLLDRTRWQSLPSYGLSRTLCLLLSVGGRCIVLDDDVVCSAVEPQVQGQGVRLGDSAREMQAFADLESLLGASRTRAQDAIAGHSECLGLGFAAALKSFNAADIATECAGMHGGFARLLHADSPVLVTQCGSLGDPGTSNSHFFYSLDAASIERLLQQPFAIDVALNSRAYWVGRSRPTFTKMSVMSQVTGLDNRAALPPYFPVFRGEDSLFGAMVEYLFPDSVALEYDWAVPHLPLEARGGDAAAQTMVPSGDLSLLSRYITDHTDYEAQLSPTQRYAALSQLLAGLAAMPDGELRAMFRAEVTRERAERLTQLSAAMAVPGAQQRDDWMAYLQRGVAEIQQALQQPAMMNSARGVPATLPEAELCAALREYCSEFSAVMAAWNDIRSAASTVVASWRDSGRLRR